MTIAIITSARYLALAMGQHLLMNGDNYKVLEVAPSGLSATVKLVEGKVQEETLNYYTREKKSKGEKKMQRAEWNRRMK